MEDVNFEKQKETRKYHKKSRGVLLFKKCLNKAIVQKTDTLFPRILLG